MHRHAILLSMCSSLAASAAPLEVLTAASHRPQLNVRILHAAPVRAANDAPVLFIHGSSFSSELAAGFRFNGLSWMEVMVQNGFSTYALDFLGYGRADRYPEMATGGSAPVGRAADVQIELDNAVELVLRRSGQAKVTLIAHSWGGSVAALYAQHHPEKVAALVLFAAITPRFGQPATVPHNITHAFTDMTPEQRVRAMDLLRPTDQPQALAPEMFSSWGAQWLASDPLSMQRETATVRFPSGPEQDFADLSAGHGYYDPRQIAVPTLLIRGAWDTWPSASDYEWLYGNLTAAPSKKSVIIPDGTHVVHLERNRFALYGEVLHFLRESQVVYDGHPENSTQPMPATVDL